MVIKWCPEKDVKALLKSQKTLHGIPFTQISSFFVLHQKLQDSVYPK